MSVTIGLLLQEGILNQLQSSVESEEQKWQQRIRAGEEETKQMQEELARLKQVESSQEDTTKLNEQIKSLEDRLSSTESERETLRSQLSQVIFKYKINVV